MHCHKKHKIHKTYHTMNLQFFCVFCAFCGKSYLCLPRRKRIFFPCIPCIPKFKKLPTHFAHRLGHLAGKRGGWSRRRGSNSRRSAWEADILPLNYSCTKNDSTLAVPAGDFQPFFTHVQKTLANAISAFQSTTFFVSFINH